MVMVLGDNGAKQQGPNPQGVRDHNSPIAPAMRRLRSHDAKCKPYRHRRQLAAAPAAFAPRPSGLKTMTNRLQSVLQVLWGNDR
jgi:hypothetical protein